MALTGLLVACQPTLPRPGPLPALPRGLSAAAPLGEPPASVPPLDPRFGVVEGFANPGAMADLGAGWERAVFFWPQVQPSGPTDFSGLGRTLPRETLQAEVRRGVRMAGVLEFTPGWAALNPADGALSVPKNLDLPIEDPENYFARYVSETVRYYAGWINDWIIWNEPDFRPDDGGAGDSTTWLGTDEQFARLLKVAYLAAKQANPNASVSFPATSYWVEEGTRPLFYARLLDVLAQDPDTAEHSFFHDAVALNLYRNPDDIYRVHGVFEAIQRAHGLQKPVWLTETNAMPAEDRQAPCWQQHTDDPYHTTLEQQAAFGVQAFALAAAAGYQRIGFYKMVDDHACEQSSLWGLFRDDGSPRPVATALGSFIHAVSGYSRAQFVPLQRVTAPNWQVYQVVFDVPGNRRVSVLWNADATPVRVHAASQTVDLPAASAFFRVDDTIRDPDGYHYIGGEPVLLTQQGIDPGMPIEPPRLSG